MTTKTCSTCREVKTIDDFHKALGRPDGRQRLCKDCAQKFRINHYYHLGGQSSAKNKHLQKEFNITLEEFNKIHEHQKGLCAICSFPLKKANTDHDHKSGLVRALLCWKCNDAIGKFNENLDRLRTAIKYLEQTPEQFPVSLALGAPRYALPGRIKTKKRAELYKLLKESDQQVPLK